ncbi:MAG: chemotaxis protein CheB, partial [Aestuariivirga sp.]
MPLSRSVRGHEDFLVVGIGASAGGLDACRKLLDALPAPNGMAFILVQHLEPSHDSMMVDLLAGHTGLAVSQAVEGTPIEPNHLYVIPPGRYLSCNSGALRLTQPLERHGARLPFDFLLQSMAGEFGARAVAVILSGTGADGSAGAAAIKAKGGLVVAQEPSEAGYDGMPRSAIAAGVVDHVLAVANIPGAIKSFELKPGPPAMAKAASAAPPAVALGWLHEIIELLRARTAHDFTLYKQGTLLRRVERRMALAGIKSGETDRYLDMLRSDANEIAILAKDLLINVTSFFRDSKAFEVLGDMIVPGLVRNQQPGQPLRIWVAGCSTGEEAYSLAMLFREHIAVSKRDVRLQIFASD